MTPPPPGASAEVHSTRRGSGGARREVSERVILRTGVVELTGWTLNLSRGGVRLIVEDPVELGGEYDVCIGEDDGRKARVVWVQDESDGQIVGVQFLDADGGAPSKPPPPPGD